MGRIYFRYPDNSVEQKKAVGATIRLMLGLSLGIGFVSVVAGPSVAGWIAPNFSVPFYPLVTLAVVAAVCVQILQIPLTIARSQERAGRFVSLSLSHFGISTAGILLLVVAMSWVAPGMLWARAVAAVLVAGVGLYSVRGWFLSHSSREHGWEAIRMAAPLLPHQLVAFVLTAGNRFFLEYYRTTEEVGLYSMAYSVGTVMSVVTATLMMTWSPVFFQKAREGDDGVKTLGEVGGALIGGLIVIASIGCTLGPLAVRWLLDARYAPAAPAVALVVGGYLFHGMFSMFQLSVMQHGRTKYLAPVTVFAAIGSLVANYFLVPKYGLVGSAWATLTAYVVEATLVFFLARRLFPVPYPLRRMGLWLAGFGVVFVISQLGLADINTLALGGAAVTLLAGAVGWSVRRHWRQHLASS